MALYGVLFVAIEGVMKLHGFMKLPHVGFLCVQTVDSVCLLVTTDNQPSAQIPLLSRHGLL